MSLIGLVPSPNGMYDTFLAASNTNSKLNWVHAFGQESLVHEHDALGYQTHNGVTDKNGSDLVF